jgi:hypothetical protein
MCGCRHIQSVHFNGKTVSLFPNVLRQHTYGAYELCYPPFAFFCSSVHTFDRSQRAMGTRTAVVAPNVSQTRCGIAASCRTNSSGYHMWGARKQAAWRTQCHCGLTVAKLVNKFPTLGNAVLPWDPSTPRIIYESTEGVGHCFVGSIPGSARLFF